MKLITKEMKLKEVNPDTAGEIAKEYNLQEDDIVFIRKSYAIEQGDIKFDPGERSSIDYITTRTIDRDGEIVEPDGIILTEYLKTPVVLYCHKYYDDLPVGRCQWIKLDKKGLIAKTEYARHQKAEDIWQYRKDGFPMAKSIGFVPLEVEDLDPKKSDGARRRYPKSILLEYSDVPVPSNPDAIQIAINKGILLEEEAKEFGYIIEKITEQKETKTIDQQGNMSVFDLLNCVSKSGITHHKNEMVSMMNQENMRPVNPEDDYTYIYIRDLFPYDYPNGSVIFECHHRGVYELFQYDYSCDDNIITLLNPKKVEATYVMKPETKEYMEELMKNWFPELITKPETTDNYRHLPVMGEEGKHSNHKIRTITLSKKDGIKAKYCIDDKKVISVMFPSDKFTMAEAKKWMKDHDMVKSVFDELAISIVELEDITKNIEEANGTIAEIKSPTLIEEAMKELQLDIENLKAGRVLSEKNRKLIQECIDVMGKGTTMLSELLKVTENKTVIETNLLEIDEDEFEIDEDALKEAITASLRDVFKLDLEDVADKSIRKSFGKVY